MNASFITKTRLFICAAFVLIVCGFSFADDATATAADTLDGTTRARAMPVELGQSVTLTMPEGGNHWFKFVGTGQPVRFDVKGNSVIIRILVTGAANLRTPGANRSIYLDTRGATVEGEEYIVQLNSQRNTSGEYTFSVILKEE